MSDHQKYMQQALSLAEKGRGSVSPNPMVGCVIVKNNKVIAQGWHQKAGQSHAEILALKYAGVKARGATMYVNLEPCFHEGRTPPCVDEVIKAGIAHVVVAMKDPNPKVAGKSLRKLRQNKIQVTTGILNKEAQALNAAFIKYITTSQPYVTAKCAQTLDGRIACFNGESKWITSEKTRQLSRRMRKEFDAILIGSNTMIKDDPCLQQTKGVLKVVVDSTLKLSEKAQLFSVSDPKEILIATTDECPLSKKEAFEDKGVEVVVLPTKNKRVNLKSLLSYLGKREVARLLIEGGGTVIGSALKDKLVDEMHIFMAPKIIGDARAIPAIQGLSPKNMDQVLELSDWQTEVIGKDLFIKAKVKKS